jgi:hypothetical protein
MASTQTHNDNSSARFAEARSRYAQMNARPTDVMDSDSGNLSEATDYLRKIATQYSSNKSDRIVANSNNRPLPVPLPVVPVITDQLIVQERTNQLISSLAQNTSRESTLQMVATSTGALVEHIRAFTETLSTQLKSLNGTTAQWKDSFAEFNDDRSYQKGWLAKLTSKLTGNNGKTQMTFAEALAHFTKPIVSNTEKTVDYLKYQYDLLINADRKSNLSDARSSSQDSELRRGPSATYGMVDSVFGTNNLGRTAVDALTKAGSMFKALGVVAKSKIDGAEGAAGILGTIQAITKGGIIAKVLGIFGGIAGFITLIAGSLVFASVYALFKNPDQLAGMMQAFGSLFTEVVVPAMEWITKEILPPVAVAFGALMVAADYLLDTVGTVINKSLIWILGTAIPEAFKVLGGYVNTMWQTIKSIFWRITGMFGMGEHGEEGILTNIMWAFLELGDGLLEFFTQLPTAILRWFNLQDYIGLEDDESIYGRFKRFIAVDIPNFLYTVFTAAMAYISKLEPIKYITDKIQGVIDWFKSDGDTESGTVISTIKSKVSEFFTNIISLLTSWIPSWEDMKGWLRNVVPEGTPEFLKSWLNDKLASAGDTAKSTVAAVKATGSDMKAIVGDQLTDMDALASAAADKIADKIKLKGMDLDARNESLPTRAGALVGGVNVYAPTSSTTNNVSGGGGGGSQIVVGGAGIGSPTPPRSRLDELIMWANQF